MNRVMWLVRRVALLAVVFPLASSARPGDSARGRQNSTVRIDVLETTAPRDGANADGVVDVCVNGNWTGTCDHELQGEPQSVRVPLSSTLRIQHEAYTFDADEIAKQRTGAADPAVGGGALKLELSTPAEGCEVANDGATLVADIARFWDSVTLSEDRKSLTWSMIGDNAATFDAGGCPQARAAAQLTLMLRLPLVHNNGSKISQFMTLSSIPGEGYLLPPLLLSNKGPPSGSLDFVFVIDTTGSMWDDIDAVKVSAIELVSNFFTDVPDARMAVIDFKDHPVLPHGGPSDYPFRVVRDFTNDQVQIVSAIQSLKTGGGADWPESVYAGLMAALAPRPDHLGKQLSPWRPEARKALLVFGDAPPHDPEPVSGYTLQTVLDAAAAMGTELPELPSLAGQERQLESASNTGAAIYTLLIGKDASARAYFEALSSGTGGQSFTAANAGAVVPVLREVLGTVGQVPAPVNQAPFTLWAAPSLEKLDPPDRRMVDIDILNIVDPEGEPVTVEITAITQDEPVLKMGKGLADGAGVGTARASVRAARSGQGNGRVYRIWFVARDPQGEESTGSVRVCVPHNQGRNVACQDDGQLYDSTAR